MTKWIDHLWIPMSDGVKLGARLWLPESVNDEALSDGSMEDKAVPAILEYIPYRKDDYSAIRDSSTIAWFASRGYACLRVDMRGSGSSDGIMLDEYSNQEIDDGVEVINWLAQQDWCNGKVATIGISWGGITGLQMAQRAPKPLKTVIALGATEFRYYDDAGYYMGCMVGQTIGWATMMFGYNTRPPDPALQKDNWRSLWLSRLSETPHYLDHWLTHQREDDYWLRGSVGVDYDAIRIPVYAVSGHADCWPNTVPRLLENLSSPTRGLQGAWCHRYPHLGVPGPTVNFLEDAARWFDHWLKGEDTGIMDESTYQVFIQDSVRPKPFYDHRPGKWVGEPCWPSPNIDIQRFDLRTPNNDIGLGHFTAEAGQVTICSPNNTGLASGEYMPWFAFGPADELAGDQQQEDAGSLLFDFSIDDVDLCILGNPKVTLNLKSDQPQALIAVRLCDVWPNGDSTLITRGILNLSQRDGKRIPLRLSPGKNYDIEVSLNHVGYTVPSGHTLRVALSTSYWPIAWPSPINATLTINTDHSVLNLPLRNKDAVDGRTTKFEEFVPVEPLPTTQIRDFNQQRTCEIDETTGAHVFEINADNGKTLFEKSGLEMASTTLQRYSINADDPTSAKAEYEWEWEYSRGEKWNTQTFTKTVMTCDETHFFLEAQSIAWENDKEVFNKHWKKKYTRDHF
ncbi:MAG: CocE/NonD family hydrolase [Gammaproteobacteria bacterium]|nr:CocE/NonD family hydrolase [Gammaproteobacteria bacterium]